MTRFNGRAFEREGLGRASVSTCHAERALAQRTTYFISQARGDAARAASFGIARERDLTVIRNGVDIARFMADPPSAEKYAQNWVSRPMRSLSSSSRGSGPREGLRELVEAALALAGDPRLHVLLVGAALARDRTSLRRARSPPRREPPRLALASVGNIAKTRRACLHAADIFVLPTHREGLPRSVIEAMAAGLAVIAGDISGSRYPYSVRADA